MRKLKYLSEIAGYEKIVILTTVKIFQFLHSAYCISGQYALCRKENLIVREYKTCGKRAAKRFDKEIEYFEHLSQKRF